MHQLQSRLPIYTFLILINILWTKYKIISVIHRIIRFTFYRFIKCCIDFKNVNRILDFGLHFSWKNQDAYLYEDITIPKVCKCVCILFILFLYALNNTYRTIQQTI